MNFAVGSGPVMITNPSDDTFDVQLLSSRPAFAVSSESSILNGRSERQGTGNASTGGQGPAIRRYGDNRAKPSNPQRRMNILVPQGR